MTIDQFIRGLTAATAAEQAHWIRGKAGLRLVDPESGEVECPITFLCRVATGYVYGTGEYQRAGNHLGLGFNDAYRIVSCADILDDDLHPLPPALTHCLTDRLLAATKPRTKKAPGVGGASRR
jgi:hypothetical protein